MPTFQAAGVPTASHSSRPGSVSRVRVGGVASESATGRRGVATKTRPAAALPSSAASARGGHPTKVWPGSLPSQRSTALGVYTSPVITRAEFARAERAAERWPFATVKVDWTRQDYTGPVSDLSWCVRSLTVERSITGELPEAAGLVDGYASGELTVELEGSRPGAAMTLAEELDVYRTDSPLFGVKRTTPWLRADVGLLTEDGPKAYRQLTGPVRKLRVRQKDETVTLTALDPSERIRELVTLPTYGEFLNHAQRRNFALTVNTQWVVDYCLRKNGYFGSPPPHPRAIISCTGHGGLVSEIGFNGAPIALETTSAPNAALWTEDQHPFGMLGTPELADTSSNPADAYQEFYGTRADQETPPFKITNGNGFGWSAWVHMGPWQTGGASTERRLMQVRPTDGPLPRLFVNYFGDGSFYAGLVHPSGAITGTPKIATVGPARWRHVGVHWRWTTPTTMIVTVRVDGQTRSWTLTHAAVNVADTWDQQGYRANVQVRMMLWRAWSNMCAWWTADEVPTLAEWQARESWTSQADIAKGNNELLYLPDIAAADSWEIMKAAVRAEWGVLGFTEAGRPYFRARADAVYSTPEVELDVRDNVSSVDYEVSSDSVRNVIGYQSTAKYHDPKFQTVVKAEDILQLVIPGGKTYIYEFDWPYGAAGYQGGVLPYHKNAGQTTGWTEWSDSVTHGWTYSSGTDDTDGSNAQSVVVKYVQVDARRVRVMVNNTAGTRTIRLATPATANDTGQPALRIGGWPIVGRPTHVQEFRDQASISRYGSARSYPVPTSEWRQTPGQLDPVARALLAAMADEVPLLEDLPVRGDPRTQPGMVARARFRGEGVQPVIGTVVKVKRDLDSGGLEDLVSLRPLPLQTLAPPGWTFFVDTSRYQFDRADPINLTRVRDLGYAANIAKVGQGAGTTNGGTAYGATLDPYWTTNRDQSRQLWGDAFAGYWYVGNTEAPADQAARCKSALGDTSIPIMLDWEDGGGTWSNLLNVLAAFRSAGLRVTMLYCGSGYALNSQNGPASNIDGTGLNLIRARYWTNSSGHPRALFDDITDPRGFGLATFAGGSPDAFQFTQYGTVYPGLDMDVDAFPGTAAGLVAMIQGR